MLSGHCNVYTEFTIYREIIHFSISSAHNPVVNNERYHFPSIIIIIII